MVSACWIAPKHKAKPTADEISAAFKAIGEQGAPRKRMRKLLACFVRLVSAMTLMPVVQANCS